MRCLDLSRCRICRHWPRLANETDAIHRGRPEKKRGKSEAGKWDRGRPQLQDLWVQQGAVHSVRDSGLQWRDRSLGGAGSCTLNVVAWFLHSECCCLRKVMQHAVGNRNGCLLSGVILSLPLAAAAGFFATTGVPVYWVITIVLTGISWCLAPFLFNPYQFHWDSYVADWDSWQEFFAEKGGDITPPIH